MFYFFWQSCAISDLIPPIKPNQTLCSSPLAQAHAMQCILQVSNDRWGRIRQIWPLGADRVYRETLGPTWRTPSAPFPPCNLPSSCQYAQCLGLSFVSRSQHTDLCAAPSLWSMLVLIKALGCKHHVFRRVRLHVTHVVPSGTVVRKELTRVI